MQEPVNRGVTCKNELDMFFHWSLQSHYINMMSHLERKSKETNGQKIADSASCKKEPGSSINFYYRSHFLFFWGNDTGIVG